MSLYPTFEDMKVAELEAAQISAANAASGGAAALSASSYPSVGATPAGVGSEWGVVPAAAAGGGSLYPSLDEYMGLALAVTSETAGMTAVVPAAQQQRYQVVAPVTGRDLGVVRSEIKNGLRKCVLCKDGKGMIGLKVQSVDKGLFISFVAAESPAAMAGLRFGDQILEINGEIVAGWKTDAAMKFLKKADPARIEMTLRDRPFERTITMNKDSSNHIGFVFSNGRITHLVKDSSAARNGLLIDHQLIEVNGQNVLGLKDSAVSELISKLPRTVTVTVMPLFVYEHMIKQLGSSLLKKQMDHSVPDV